MNKLTHLYLQEVLDENRLDILEKLIQKIKIIVTFLEENTSDLLELDSNEITQEMLLLKEKALKKDKKLLTNI